MFIYAGGRRTGKTAKMIEFFLADPQNRVIITPTADQANYLIRRIKSSMGKDYPFLAHIIPFTDAGRLLRGSRHFEIGIDNLEMILHHWFSNPVKFVTVTGVKMEAPPRRRWWKFWE